MLINKMTLEGIKAGEIDLIFRKWKRPGIKKGSLIHTAVGQLEILDVTVNVGAITVSDARRAGYQALTKLEEFLDSRSGDIYKIKVGYYGTDPRIEFRNRTDFTPEELQKIISKLSRMDTKSAQGNWVVQVLTTIKEHPLLRAADLAKQVNRPKDWLKINIRKLKNIGLTISHETGYTLSPRGEVILEKLVA